MSQKKTQGDSESFDQFMTELRLLVKDCNDPNGDEMVRDQIIFGISSSRVRKQLLYYGPYITLENAIDSARSHELSQQQLKTMISPAVNLASQSVHAVNRWTNKGEHRRHGRKMASGADSGTVRSK